MKMPVWIRLLLGGREYLIHVGHSAEEHGIWVTGIKMLGAGEEEGKRETKAGCYHFEGNAKANI